MTKGPNQVVFIERGGLCIEAKINGKEALGPNQVFFIERWSLYRGQNQMAKDLLKRKQVVWIQVVSRSHSDCTIRRCSKDCGLDFISNYM